MAAADIIACIGRHQTAVVVDVDDVVVKVDVVEVAAM